MEMISFNDFQKIDIRVGFVEKCVKLEQSNKMLKLDVDFGELGKRTVLTGLGEFMSPEEFEAKKILFVFNVEPRKMLGFESQAIIMGTDEEDPKIIFAPDDAQLGARVI